MRATIIVGSSLLLWATVLVVAVLQWTGRWRSWASSRDAPGYALVNNVFGMSPLPPAIFALNVPLVLGGVGLSMFLHFDPGAYLVAVLSLSLIGLAVYIYIRQPRWSIPPWLRQSRRPKR